MGENEKVVGYISKVRNLVRSMKGCGETMSDKMIVEKVMRTLTSHFNHVIMAIQEVRNLNRLKLEVLVCSLQARELRIIERRDVQESIQALQVQTWKKHDGSSKTKGKFDKGYSRKGSWFNSHKLKNDEKLFESSKKGGCASNQKEKHDKKGVQCYNCNKWGHLAKNCSYKKAKIVAKDKDNEGENIAHEKSKDYETMVFMVAVSDD